MTAPPGGLTARALIDHWTRTPRRMGSGKGAWAAAAALSFALIGSAAAEIGAAGDPWRLCFDAIAREERMNAVPRNLLAAIAFAESGRRHPVTDDPTPWPWSVMSEGRGRYLPSKAAAIEEVRGLQARGVRNIDVGCMQINLQYHPDAFASLEEAFHPQANVAYAAQYLRELYEDLGSWEEAAGRYHSATPMHKEPYQARVLATWRGLGGAGGTMAAALADASRPRVLRVPRDADGLPAPPPPTAFARSRQPTPAMLAELQRQARGMFADRGAASPGVVRVQPRDGAAVRDVAAEARFAARREEYMQAWRDSRPVTVIRGSAEKVYSFELR